MADLVGDVRYVLRGWRRAPGISAAMLATLTPSVGLAAAIFSFADGYLFRPLPFPTADRLYLVLDPNATPRCLHASDASELRRSSIAHWDFVEWGDGFSGNLVIGNRHVGVYAHSVSYGFRKIGQLPLLAGRDYGGDDHREGGPVAAWLTHRFWQRDFGGDPGALGRKFRVQGPPDIVVPRVDETAVGRSELAVPSKSRPSARSVLLPGTSRRGICTWPRVAGSPRRSFGMSCPSLWSIGSWPRSPGLRRILSGRTFGWEAPSSVESSAWSSLFALP